MITPIFLAFVKKGKVVFKDTNSIASYLSSLEGKSVQVVIKTWRKSRTNQQNRWYWRCVVGIPAEYYGYLPEEMHDAFKLIFLRCHDEGKPEMLKSTTSLTTKEFSDYCEKCRQWCAEHDIVIPDPETVDL
ncbi:MAG: hypothetical protein WC318_07370 [Candidatus Omnitrophota bacterium]|jgi:hypothetical protein